MVVTTALFFCCCLFTVFSMVMFMYFTFSDSDTEDIDIEHRLINETNLKLLKSPRSVYFSDVIIFFLI